MANGPNGLLDFISTPVGQGLLGAVFGAAANAGRGGTWNTIGRAGLMGVTAMSAAQQRLLEEEERKKTGMYRDMQMRNIQSEIETRTQAEARRKANDEYIERVLGGTVPPAQSGQLGSGSFNVVPPPPGMPAIPTAPPMGARVPGLNFDQLALLKRRGLDLVDLHKYANDPRKYEAGSVYENRVTGQREQFPKLPEGMAQGPGGTYGFVPGYQDSVVGLEGAKARATEGARADLDPVQVIGQDGAARYVPRSVVTRPQPRPATPQPSAGPADADRYAILTQELAKAEATGNAQDAAALRNEIARLSPSARTTPSPSGLAVAPGFQATPTSAQAAEAAAAKVKAEADARAASDRQAGKAKKSDQASDMLNNISRARNLLQMDPTGSLVGAGVDKVMGAFGVTTGSANTANSLETIAGWLTMNTPRMEGPQSNFDQELYKTMAGRVGDRTLPAQARLEALNEVERIQKRYAGLNGTEQTAQQPKANLVNELPKTAQKGARARDTATGKVLVFNGMTWVPEK